MKFDQKLKLYKERECANCGEICTENGVVDCLQEFLWNDALTWVQENKCPTCPFNDAGECVADDATCIYEKIDTTEFPIPTELLS